MQKTELRSYMRLRRKTLDFSARQKWQKAAMKNLLSLPELQRAACMYSFVSCGTEIDTLEIIRYLLAEGKQRVGVPRVSGEQMEFVEIHSLDALRPGAMNILEPVEGEIMEAREGIMLMPGLAFDKLGNRVGYGAGYYDRYLEQYDTGNLYKVGYAFDFQVIEESKAEEHDRRVDCIVTDCNVYHI